MYCHYSRFSRSSFTVTQIARSKAFPIATAKLLFNSYAENIKIEVTGACTQTHRHGTREDQESQVQLSTVSTHKSPHCWSLFTQTIGCRYIVNRLHLTKKIRHLTSYLHEQAPIPSINCNLSTTWKANQCRINSDRHDMTAASQNFTTAALQIILFEKLSSVPTVCNLNR